MQKYSRIYEYVQEYKQLVYDVYGKHAPAYLITYYNINVDSTVWDNDTLFNGPYEQLGELSGVKFNKILLLPIYYIEEVDYTAQGEEQGVVNISESHIVFPSTYGITPYAHDLIKFSTYPTIRSETLFSVTGVAHTETEPHFWKVKLINEQNFTPTMAENQVENTYTFFDYDKKIHQTDHVITMTKLLSKNENITLNLKNLFDQNSGLYFT